MRAAPLLSAETTKRHAPAIAAVAAVLALLAYALPKVPRNPLAETTAWSLLVITAFAGFGSVLRAIVAPREQVDLGLRVTWGMGMVAFLGGTLMVPSLMNRGASFLVVEVGVALAVASIVRERDAVAHRARYVVRVARRYPAIAVAGLVVAGLVALQYLTGVTDWHTNPYDDDIAYVAFVKKLLDTGSIIEPFSLRRLSTLGGQTLYIALVAVRATSTQAHTFDRSICVLVIALLVLGFRSRRQRPATLVSLLTIASFILLPLSAINTASYYSGVVFFLGLMRTMQWASDRDRGAFRNAAPLALVGAASCTLRQNYLPVPVVTLGAYYFFRFLTLKRTPPRDRLVEPAAVTALSAIVLFPWLVVSYQSNRTLFYPLMLGTANPSMLFESSGITFLRELQIQIGVPLDGLPLKTFVLFLLAVPFVREREVGKPLRALTIGAIASSIAVVHGLTQSDAGNIGRYAFGFFMAVAIGVTLSAGIALRRERGWLAIAPAALTVPAFVVQVGLTRELAMRQYARWLPNIDIAAHEAPRSFLTITSAAHAYARLQGAVPPGERMAVLVDEPHYLDFARNPIWNLDMPGYTSLPPYMPYFQGSPAVEEYFKGVGVRYVAFVEEGYSRYHYRRKYWVGMLADEQEIWRAHAPYLIDFVDNLADIARRHRRVHEERGMVVVDLKEGS